MKSGGQTKVTDIGVGRQLLCKEKPKTKPTSKCAKNLAKTVKAAKKGLTAKQQKLWLHFVYTPALLQVGRFCATYRVVRTRNPFSDESSPPRSKDADYKVCANRILTSTIKFKGLLGKKFKWADYLINGAKMIKKLPVPRSVIKIKIGGTNPNSGFFGRLQCKHPKVRKGKRCACKSGYVPYGNTCKKKASPPRIKLGTNPNS